MNTDIEDIKSKLDLIIKQNSNIQYQLEKISTALFKSDDTENYSKAVEDFLNEFMNNYP